ncbi:MAG: acetyl-CoA carboxylase biotin carboxyl carrier protein subunit [Vicinamibacterales bacterium]
MARRGLLLRDDSGREHSVRRFGDEIAVGDVVVTVKSSVDGSLRIIGDRSVQAWSVTAGERIWVFLEGAVYTFESADTGSRPRGAGHHGSLAAPMPSTVRQVAVAPGDIVRKGDVLIVLEAMKMELPVRAIGDGTIVALNCQEGDLVQAGQELVTVE